MPAASFLAVYAFIGFEDIVHMAEEVKRPRRAMPVAIASALLVAAVFYVAVSMAALMVVDPARLAQSDAPLVEVSRAAGYAAWPLALLSLWIILNGALAQIFMASRVLYRLGESAGAPAWMSQVNPRTDTPALATAFVTAIIIVLAVAFPLQTLAAATSLIMLLVFMASNAALIILERREPEAAFDVPVILPWFGLLLTALLIAGNFLIEGAGH